MAHSVDGNCMFGREVERYN